MGGHVFLDFLPSCVSTQVAALVVFTHVLSFNEVNAYNNTVDHSPSSVFEHSLFTRFANSVTQEKERKS